MPTPAFYDSPDPRIHYGNPNLFWDIGLVEGGTMPDKPLIKLELTKLSEQELIDLGTLVHTNMAKPENAAIVTGAPYTAVQMSGFTTGFTGARQAQINAAQVAKAATTAKGNAKKAQENGLTSISKFLESKPDATEAMYEAIGFAVRAQGGPPPIVPPEGLSLTFGDGPGEVDAHWNPLRGAIAYILQSRLANTPGAPWVTGYEGSRSSCTVGGLTPGALYEFQVCALFAGQNSPGPACAVAEQRAS